MFHQNNPIGKLEDRRSMRHDNRGAISDIVSKDSMDFCFAIQINLTCCLIQNQNARVGTKGSSECDPLALSAG